MGLRMRLSSYCSNRGDDTVNLVTSCKTNARLVCVFVCTHTYKLQYYYSENIDSIDSYKFVFKLKKVFSVHTHFNNILFSIPATTNVLFFF